MEALEVFTSEEVPIRNSDTDELGINNYSIKKLKDENWIRPVELEVEPDTLDLEFDPDLIKELNEEQSSVFSSIEKSIREKEFNNFY